MPKYLEFNEEIGRRIKKLKSIEPKEERWISIYDFALTLLKLDHVDNSTELALKLLENTAAEGYGKAEDFCSHFEKYFSALWERAQGGDPAAQNKLGDELYESSYDDLALYWWLKAAAHIDDSDLVWVIYRLYAEGGSGVENEAEAVRWLHVLVDRHKDYEAVYLMAKRLISGTGVAQDVIAGWRLMYDSAEAGYAPAQTDFALEIMSENVNAAIYVQAVGLLEKAAQSSTNAKIHLGHLLERGFNGSGSIKDALALYESAGPYAGPPEIARLYKSISQQFATTHEDGMKARPFAEAGALEAQFHLGLVLMSNTDVKHDIENAAYWLKIAADRGHVLAKSAYDQLSQTIEPKKVLRQICHSARETLKHNRNIWGDDPLL